MGGEWIFLCGPGGLSGRCWQSEVPEARPEGAHSRGPWGGGASGVPACPHAELRCPLHTLREHRPLLLSPWPWQLPGTAGLLVRLTGRACWAKVGGQDALPWGSVGLVRRATGHWARSGAGALEGFCRAQRESGVPRVLGAWARFAGWGSGGNYVWW